MPRRVLPCLFGLLLFTALSGCFGDVEAVYVPNSDVPTGWDHVVQNKTEETANGVVDITTNRYARQGFLIGEVYLIGVTDVPGVDEHDQIRKQIQAYADAEGVTMQTTGESEVRLDNGQRVEATAYDITKEAHGATVTGKAWFLRWDAGAFAAGGIGWATDQRPSLLGMEDDDSAWLEAQSMLRATEW